MVDKDSRERIKQMISFIRAEAEEKAKDIQNDTEQEYELSKNKYLQLEKEKVQTQFDKKWKQLDVKKKIDKSAAINQSRLKKMTKRQTCMEQVLDESTHSLQKITQDQKKYKPLLQNLIVQGLIKLCEPLVEVKCRKSDLQLVQEVIEPAKVQFIKFMKQETGREYQLEIYVSAKYFLEESTFGGVILLANKGKTRCINTLNERLQQVYASNLPQVRKMLFT